MFYSISEAALKIGVSTSTLRYYDKEGLLPNIARSNGGIRIFSEKDIEALRIIECLKTTGMSIKEIKTFIDYCVEGDASLSKRLDIFLKRKEIVEQQIDDLQKTLTIINYKCWYYKTACKNGTEKEVLNIIEENLPKEIQEYKKLIHQ